MARIHVLGAGTTTPTPTRFGSSYVVELRDRYLMIDCGPATTYKMVRAGIWPTKVDHLFFTHHHFDHDVDYPCFPLCRWDQSIGDENQLQVYGPKLTETLTHRILDEADGAFAHDWYARVNLPASQRVYINRGGELPRKPPDVFAKDIGPGRVLSSADWDVTAAPAVHAQPYLDSLAYRLDSPEGSLVFTGDTEPCQSVIDLARDADVMLCMCWDEEEAMILNGEESGVCGTMGAARMAQEAGVKKLVLVHVGPNLSGRGNMEKGISDAKKIYEGELVFSDELMSVEV